MTEAGILGKNDFELMPGIYATICRLTDQEAITSNKLVVSEETWDNQTFESVKFPVEYDKGKIGVGGYIRDISERKRIQEELIRLNAELEHRVLDRTAELQATNKELESFSYSVSHDLRAPLRAIDGLTKILLEKYESTFNDEEKQLCGLLQDNAHKMERLIDDLLRFSRTNRTKLKIASIDMKELVQSVYNELTSNEKNRRIEFQLGDLHPVSGDKMLIRQVWVNLISNAIKFSSHREQSVITISSNIEDNKTVYCITDNGAGFNMRYIDKLFGVFQRLHTTREFEGTGVGLAIAHNIVKRHNGKIWAAAEVDKGATFKFSLPI